MAKPAKILWSPSRAGFYPAAAPYPADALPGDLIAVTPKRYAALLDAAAQSGRAIVAGADGAPNLAPPTCQSGDQLRAALHRRIKREAARRINAVAPLWKQVNAMRHGSDPGWDRIDLIRSASDAIEESFAGCEGDAPQNISTHPFWPEFD